MGEKIIHFPRPFSDLNSRQKLLAILAVSTQPLLRKAALECAGIDYALLRHSEKKALDKVFGSEYLVSSETEFGTVYSLRDGIKEEIFKGVNESTVREASYKNMAKLVGLKE
jgi:hypothetical protein